MTFDWHPWMAIVLWGMAGGLGGTLFVTGFDVPIPEEWRKALGLGNKSELGFHLFRNLISGGLAGWANWILYTPITEATQVRPINEQVILGTIIAGGVGASLVSSLLSGASKKRKIEEQETQLQIQQQGLEEQQRVINTTADVLPGLVASLEDQISGGDEPGKGDPK